MRYAICKQRLSTFRRDRLPGPSEYFQKQGLKLVGGGECKPALYPFHNDTRPSLRVCSDNGTFRCMVSYTHRGGLYLIEAAQLAPREVSR